MLEYTVSATGMVEDVLVRESTGTEFETAAIAAVEQYLYDPRYQDGVPIESPGIRKRIEFDLARPNAELPLILRDPQPGTYSNAMPIVRIAPGFPDAAAEAGLKSGHVVVAFSLNAQGEPENLAVVESSSPLFEDRAIELSSRAKYRPRIENGVPVASDSLRYRVDFTVQE